ncbi:isoprenoid synthase domain-containing protein [Scenedesmus sp. NREL 46B-D3]|nr:isoprenoid synthase domain-containing protein [Scenedesmus sp. NREL 46B-D3]
MCTDGEQKAAALQQQVAAFAASAAITAAALIHPLPAAADLVQTVPASQVTQTARPLPKQYIDKSKVWVVFIGSAASLFILTVAAENNGAWFPAIARANAAMTQARKKAEQPDENIQPPADIEAEADVLPPLSVESAALEAEIERRNAAAEAAMLAAAKERAELERQSKLVEEGLFAAKKKVLQQQPEELTTAAAAAAPAAAKTSSNRSEGTESSSHSSDNGTSISSSAAEEDNAAGYTVVADTTAAPQAVAWQGSAEPAEAATAAAAAAEDNKVQPASASALAGVMESRELLQQYREQQQQHQQQQEQQQQQEAFLDVYATLREELLNDKMLEGQPQEAREWLKEMLDYNVPGGKLNRGMAVYDVLVSIKGAENLTKDDIFKANALGWCIEWLQAFFLVADDIMDGSITRRGQPCWYKQPKCCIYRILKFYFGGSPAYGQLLELFLETTYQTSHGQLLDLTTAPPGSIDLSRYTMDSYLRIVTYKTAFYTFYLPVASGLVLAGETRPAAFDLARSICVTMGQYFQIQDDFLDCYGDPAVIGKIGTDVEDAKCCWLVCTALKEASEEQKAVIKANYGQKDPAAVAKVKEVYAQLGLAGKFEAYEAESHAQLTATIEEQSLLPKQVFISLLAKIYKRQK